MAHDWLIPANQTIFPSIYEDVSDSPSSRVSYSLSIFRDGEGIDFVQGIGQKRRTWKCKVTGYDEDLLPMLVAFSSNYGSYKGFWLPIPSNQFTNAVFIDAETIEVDYDESQTAEGEFLYIETESDDIARIIRGVSVDDGKTTFSVDEITIADIENPIILCRELVYVRFAGDDIDVTYTTDSLASASVEFIELFGETSLA